MAQTTVDDRVQNTSRLDDDAMQPSSANPVTVPADHGKSSLHVHRPATFEAIAKASGGGNMSIAAKSFLALVIAPFIIACVYYLGVATPQFVAEARFAVRTLGGPDTGGLGSNLLATTPLQQEAYVVTSFIHCTFSMSPAIVAGMPAASNVRASASLRGEDPMISSPRP